MWRGGELTWGCPSSSHLAHGSASLGAAPHFPWCRSKSNGALRAQLLSCLRCFQIFLFVEGAESLPPSVHLGMGKEREIWAELTVGSLKSFLL